MAARRTAAETVSGGAGEAHFARRLSLRVVGLATALVLGALLAMSVYALQAFERLMEPEMRNKAATLAVAIADDVERALGFGIRLTDLRGVDEFLDTEIADHPEVRYAAIVDPEGVVRFASSVLDPDRAGGQGLSAAVRAALGSHFAGPRPASEGERFRAVEDFLDIWVPIHHGDVEVARLHVGIDVDFVEKQLLEILADILIVLFVSVLITLEVLLLIMTLTVTRSVTLLGRIMAFGGASNFGSYAAWRSSDELGRLILRINAIIRELNDRYDRARERAARAAGGAGSTRMLDSIHEQFALNGVGSLIGVRQTTASDVRLPLFVYFFGIELSRSFFPIFVGKLYEPIPYLSEEMVIALPMSVWVVAMLVTTPFGGRLIRRFGAQAALLIGMVPSTFGLVMTGFASNIYELLVWRSLTAAGFGVVTVSGLVYVAILAERGRRAQGMSVFVAATVAASICATSIGGILADRIGYSNTFFVAAGLVVLASVLVLAFLDSGTSDAPQSTGRRPVPAYVLFANVRLMLFMMLSAVPARVMLTGFFFFLTPLALAQQSYDSSAIGRVMMVYFIVMLIMTPVSARIADHFGNHPMLLVLGGLCAGGGAIVFSSDPAVWVLVAGVALTGFGQSFIMSPQLAVIPEFFRAECARHGVESVIVVFRTVERFGSIGGPMVAAAYVERWGLVDGALAMGVTMMALTGLLALFLLTVGLTRTADDQESAGAA